jgi:hypothetical protein
MRELSAGMLFKIEYNNIIRIEGWSQDEYGIWWFADVPSVRPGFIATRKEAGKIWGGLSHHEREPYVELSNWEKAQLINAGLWTRGGVKKEMAKVIIYQFLSIYIILAFEGQKSGCKRVVEALPQPAKGSSKRKRFVEAIGSRVPIGRRLFDKIVSNY